MSLEQEAAAFTKAKQTQFNEAMFDYLEPLIMYVEDNLHNTRERSLALTKLDEFRMWCRECASIHGIK